MLKLKVGVAEVMVFNIGDLAFALKDTIAVPEDVWRARYGSLFEKRMMFPTQSVLVSAAGRLILVDVGEYSKFAADGGDYVEKSYQPPPGLVEQLGEHGIKADQINHVVITHAHFDHFVGAITTKDGESLPTFPKARYYLGRGDWEWHEMRKALESPASMETKTFGELHRRGVLELVAGDEELAPGIAIISAPGESPGHQILKVESQGQTLYCVGDLFHHRVEVENPKWMAPWCDPQTNLLSREALTESALRENAIVVPTHALPGRIVRVGEGNTFAELSAENFSC